MRNLLVSIGVLMYASMSYGQQVPLTSLKDLQPGDYTTITRFYYVQDRVYTCTSLASMVHDIHKINRRKDTGGIVYFDYTHVSHYPEKSNPEKGKTFTDSKMLRAIDGRRMQKYDEYRFEPDWVNDENAIITRFFGKRDSIAHGAGEGKRVHVFGVTWGAIKNIMQPDCYDEIRKRVADCTDCTIALVVEETTDFFGKEFDTTFIDIYRRGYWYPAGTRRQYGWIDLLRPSGGSGPFFITNIRIQTMSRLAGKDR